MKLLSLERSTSVKKQVTITALSLLDPEQPAETMQHRVQMMRQENSQSQIK